MHLTRQLKTLQAAICMGAVIAPVTFAAAPARANEQEIIVTAQKREQSIMDVGVAVTAFSGEALRSQGMQDFAAIANQVPNFTVRSEEHTSELQSLMRISYAVFCLKKKTNKTYTTP